MKLLEAYAQTCGVQLNSPPKMIDSYYPIPESKYVVFHNAAEIPQKQYSYFQEVLELVLPKLRLENYQIYQIGDSNSVPLDGAIDLRGKLSLSQLNYLIKNCSLLVGNDTFSSHIAGSHGIPTVTLFGVTTIENNAPYWAYAYSIYLEPDRKKYPPFLLKESKKSIDEIKVETVAAAICKILFNINYKTIETVRVGNLYLAPILEVIPNIPTIFDDKNIMANVRMDYHFNENCLAHILQQVNCSIFTKNPINENLIKTFKQRIKMISYLIDKNTKKEDFIRMVKTGVPIRSLYTGDDLEFYQKLKLEYFDYFIEHEKEKTFEDFSLILSGNEKFKTNKVLIANGGQKYSSYAHFLKNIVYTEENGDKIIFSKDFSKDLEHFFIYQNYEQRTT